MRSLYLSVGRRDGGSVRIMSRTTQRVVHTLDEIVRHCMLQTLCFFMDVVPGVSQLCDQVQLDDPMTPQHPERLPLPGFSELHALIGGMLQQTGFGQALHHAAH